MSKAIELARLLGYHSWVNHGEELESFYHAARAEALREAADELKKIEIHHDSFAYKMLRAIADMEERQCP